MDRLIQSQVSYNAMLPVNSTRSPGNFLSTYEPSLRFTQNVAPIQTLEANVSNTIVAWPIAQGANQVGVGPFLTDKIVRRLVSGCVIANGPLSAGTLFSGFLCLGVLNANGTAVTYSQIGDRQSFSAGSTPLWCIRATSDQELIIPPRGLVALYIDQITLGINPGFQSFFNWTEWAPTGPG